MMPRSQIAALAVLLVGLGVVLVLVGDTGVSTGVFLPDQPTETVTPSPTPSPTPTPEADGGNWSASPDRPSELTYAADPAVDAEIVYQTTSYDEMVGLLGFDPPAADDQYPLVTLLAGIRAEFESQISESQITMEPDGMIGPVIEVIEGLPVATLRVRVAPQTTGIGQEFSGLDLVQMFVDHADGNVTFLQYAQRGELNLTVYADFRAWLTANIVEITSEGPEATPEATLEAGATPQPDTGPTQEVTEEVPLEPTTEAEVTPDAAEEVTPEPTAEAEVTPEATEEAALGPEPTVQAGDTPAEPEEKWSEMTPGQVIHTASQAAGIMYAAVPLDEFAADTGVEMVEGAPLPTAEIILNVLRGQLEAELEQGTITVDEENFVGPVTEDVSGVPFIYLRVTVLPQTTSDGEELPGQEVVIGLIETGANRLTVVRFISQADADPTIYADFLEWLAENMPRLSTLEITETSGE